MTINSNLLPPNPNNSNMVPTTTNPDRVIPPGLSPEERRAAHQHYVNNYNVWKKRSLTKIGLAKWKHSRNKLPWCQEGL